MAITTIIYGTLPLHRSTGSYVTVSARIGPLGLQPITGHYGLNKTKQNKKKGKKIRAKN